jgi:hypothetical protein
LTRSGVPVSAVLDEAAELVRALPGWAGLLALASFPLRFAEAHFVNRLAQLGAESTEYMNHLTAISWVITFALLPALWGRAVFARACSLALSGGAPGLGRIPARQVLRLSPAGFLSYVWVALVFEALFFAVGWTVVALPLVALLIGLAAATSPLQERPGLLASLLVVLRNGRPLGTLLGLTIVFVVALPVAFLNLSVLFWFLLWLAGGTTGLDLTWWQVALTWNNRQFVLLVLAGSLSLIEPFWLAALVATVRRARAQQSGEDLRAWFAALRAEDEEAA